VSCFSAETRWTPMLGVSEIPDEITEHKRMRCEHVHVHRWRKRRQKNLLKTAQASKVVSPFTRALVPPFIGRRRDFYFRKYPQIQGIFLMWTHTLMSFTTHTFTSVPLVHTLNPDFWGNVFDLASCWFANLLFMEAFLHHNLRIL
jgi:hypothetical protein